jgi:hypothetical protein
MSKFLAPSPIPTTSDLAKFMAEFANNFDGEVIFEHNCKNAFAAFCDKHNVDIKIEKRG